MNFPGNELGLLPDLTRNCLDLWAIVLSDTTSGEALEQNPTAAPAERTNREAGERGLRLSLHAATKPGVPRRQSRKSGSKNERPRANHPHEVTTTLQLLSASCAYGGY